MWCTLTAGLAGCAWFIPPEKSTPRYNTVMGEPRRPELNPASGTVPVLPSADVAPVPAVTAQGNMSPPSVQVPQAGMPTMEAADSDGAQAGALARRVPLENANTAAMAGSGYPSLNSVPPSPAMADPDAAGRLARVRAQLEQEREDAAAQRTRLNADAVSDSSWNAPGNMPAVRTSPMPAAPTVITPTAPLSGVPSSQEPIMLRSPQQPAPAMPASGVSYNYNPGIAGERAQPLLPPASGGFDPLAGTSQASPDYNGNTNAYLPPSRYQRGY